MADHDEKSNDNGNTSPSSSSNTDKNPTTYKGNCHCGLIRYIVDLPTPIKKAHACNCSVCSRNGILWIFPKKAEDMKIERGEGEMGGYAWGKKTIVFKFCPICGTTLYAVLHVAPDSMQLAVNARTIHYFDPLNIEISAVDGKSLDGPHHHPPESKPVEFEGQVPEGEKVYRASCHCGDVRYAVRMKPLEEEGGGGGGAVVGEVSTCDCSICTRNAHIFVYPPLSSITFSPSFHQNTTQYQFGSKIVTHLFCKNCGCSMGATWEGGQSWDDNGGDGEEKGNEAKKEDKEEKEEKEEKEKKKKEPIMACNVRMWEGVDLEKLKYKERFAGSGIGKAYQLGE